MLAEEKVRGIARCSLSIRNVSFVDRGNCGFARSAADYTRYVNAIVYSTFASNTFNLAFYHLIVLNVLNIDAV